MDNIKMDKKEIDKLFEGCHSNLEAPLIGRVFRPLCPSCKNFVVPEDPFKPFQCGVYGKLPEEIYYADQAPCEHYSAKEKK